MYYAITNNIIIKAPSKKKALKKYRLLLIHDSVSLMKIPVEETDRLYEEAVNSIQTLNKKEMENLIKEIKKEIKTRYGAASIENGLKIIIKNKKFKILFDDIPALYFIDKNDTKNPYLESLGFCDILRIPLLDENMKPNFFYSVEKITKYIDGKTKAA